MPDDMKLKIAEETDDPYDLAKLRVSQDFLETAPVKKLLTTVPMRKPGPQDFVRVHPSPAYRDLVALLELKDDREIYVVNLADVPEVQAECFIANLFTAIPANLVCPTIPFVKWLKATQRSAPCVSCAVRSPKCASPTWL